MHALVIVVRFAAVLLALGLMLAIYLIASINARGNREDEVVSMSGADAGADEYLRVVGGAAGQAPTAGNSMRVYQNGDAIFPPMLDAIAAARAHVHFATFVYEPGRMAETFAEAFCAAAARGVEVRIVLDADGSKKAPPELIERMRQAGCDVRWFRRAQWYDWEKYNRRIHRRILVADGSVGFTGGVGIADHWMGNGDSPAHWRDTHACITGPAVASLQRAFVDSWNDATGELILGATYFPALGPRGDTRLCFVQSSPANATSTAQRTVAALIAGARRSLRITNPYFVPTPAFVDALCEARRRGVDVRILVPGPFHNKPPVRRASRYTWPRLLAGGVRLFEHQRTMVHAKVIVVDDTVLLVGSINFDPRSFALNSECAAIAYDPALARAAAAQFETDLGSAREVTQADIDQRSVIDRAIDGGAYWLRAQL